MSRLLLSDEKAQELIKALKHIVKRHVINFDSSPRGKIQLKDFSKNELSIHYNISVNVEGKYTIHMMDERTKHTLVRLNVGNSFHKNANGDMIRGNRVNVFSAEEFYQKNDGNTHYKAYSLPYENLDVHFSFSGTLTSFLEYTNAQQNDKLIHKSNFIQLELLT